MQNKKSPFKRGKPRYEVQNKTNGPTEVYLYDEIGFFGIEAETFVKDLKDIKGSVLVRINSPGGCVFDGTSIFNAIKERKEQTDVIIDGLAASAASYIAMAGDTVTMNQGGMLMIHEAMNIAIGNAQEMRKMAEILDKVDGQIANFYAKRSGKSVDKIRDLMAEETWFDGQEAKDLGLIDEVVEESPAENYFDLSIFNNVPDSLAQPSNSDTLTRKNVEEALRNAGMSRAQAKAFYAEAKHTLEPVDMDEVWAAAEKLKLKMRG